MEESSRVILDEVFSCRLEIVVGPITLLSFFLHRVISFRLDRIRDLFLSQDEYALTLVGLRDVCHSSSVVDRTTRRANRVNSILAI